MAHRGFHVAVAQEIQLCLTLARPSGPPSAASIWAVRTKSPPFGTARPAPVGGCPRPQLSYCPLEVEQPHAVNHPPRMWGRESCVPSSSPLARLGARPYRAAGVARRRWMAEGGGTAESIGIWPRRAGDTRGSLLVCKVEPRSAVRFRRSCSSRVDLEAAFNYMNRTPPQPTSAREMRGRRHAKPVPMWRSLSSFVGAGRHGR